MNENNIDAFKLSYFDAKDWDSLYEMIRMVNASPKEGEKTAEDIIQDIEDVRSGKKPISILSENFDLQNVVAGFLHGELDAVA